MKVTFTPSHAQGTLLRVVVLTGAAQEQPGGTKTADTSAAPGFDQPVPVAQAGSLVYGALFCGMSQAFLAASGTVITGVQQVVGECSLAVFRSADPAAGPGTPSYGAQQPLPDPGAYAAAEILAAAGGQLAEDASAPPNALGLSGAPLSTADFTPPAGSLLVAQAACGGPGAPVTAAVTSDGPVFTQAAWFAEARPGGMAGGAGIWVART